MQAQAGCAHFVVSVLIVVSLLDQIISDWIGSGDRNPDLALSPDLSGKMKMNSEGHIVLIRT
jgi:hypothetical protein